jgi:hypothetical protein
MLPCGVDLDGVDEHYEVGIMEGHCTLRPSKRLELSPTLKFKARNGFRRAKARVEDVLVGGDIERVRLRRTGVTDVGDLAAAVIFRMENSLPRRSGSSVARNCSSSTTSSGTTTSSSGRRRSPKW